MVVERKSHDWNSAIHNFSDKDKIKYKDDNSIPHFNMKGNIVKPENHLCHMRGIVRGKFQPGISIWSRIMYCVY